MNSQDFTIEQLAQLQRIQMEKERLEAIRLKIIQEAHDMRVKNSAVGDLQKQITTTSAVKIAPQSNSDAFWSIKSPLDFSAEDPNDDDMVVGNKGHVSMAEIVRKNKDKPSPIPKIIPPTKSRPNVFSLEKQITHVTSFFKMCENTAKKNGTTIYSSGTRLNPEQTMLWFSALNTPKYPINGQLLHLFVQPNKKGLFDHRKLINDAENAILGAIQNGLQFELQKNETGMFVIRGLVDFQRSFIPTVASKKQYAGVIKFITGLVDKVSNINTFEPTEKTHALTLGIRYNMFANENPEEFASLVNPPQDGTFTPSNYKRICCLMENIINKAVRENKRFAAVRFANETTSNGKLESIIYGLHFNSSDSTYLDDEDEDEDAEGTQSSSASASNEGTGSDEESAADKEFPPITSK